MYKNKTSENQNKTRKQVYEKNKERWNMHVCGLLLEVIDQASAGYASSQTGTCALVVGRFCLVVVGKIAASCA
ncbi:hypothetical protein T01_6086 [Trichinella spiralis]|uniref:Uncharacterized protein n=1 Tax=Trichinella spiralis TaxID=6334 RepID=A0A0V1AVF7_TRISP|nr:hypothetical protein T01_6086 [Trichinella spiralis]